jgi:hypothetical protein
MDLPEAANPISVTDPARKLLLDHLAADPRARYIRVHVGRG